jgi:ribose transport system ATP-binding protein
MKIELSGIKKTFGSINVLKGINLNIDHAEIHALMGENGAGKSTLIKVLTGVYKKDEGIIKINGKEVTINSIKIGQELGIAYVHQELNVVKEMSIVDNLFLGRELKNKNGMLDLKGMYSATLDVLKQLHLDFSPKTLIKDLNIGSQQMIEIAKALLQDAKLIILDEPTAALTNKEIDVLFSIIRQLQENNVSFLYVSHRMNEVFELSEKISVLRDGRYIGTADTKNISEDELVQMMIGKTVDNLFENKKAMSNEKVLEVVDLSKKDQFSNVTFDLYKGEVLGFSGLMGSGRSEIMHCIFGSEILDSGKIFIDKKEVKINSPLDAYKNGIAFVTEDRKEQGLILDFSIKDNIILPSLEKVKKFFIEDKVIDEVSKNNIKKLNIKCANEDQLVKNLSGGNQQKVVFSKWIETNPRILILDEPTRGVDIGAKKEIYSIINELKEEGVSIILVSSELSEVVGLSDRVAVMHNKRLAKIFNTGPFDQDQILKTAFLGGDNLE